MKQERPFNIQLAVLRLPTDRGHRGSRRTLDRSVKAELQFFVFFLRFDQIS